MSRRLAIVGGGIAGLTAAYYATKKLSDTSITVLEAGPRWGGKIVTERVKLGGGTFVIEGGPDTFLATKPYATNLCKELRLGDRLHGTNPDKRNTYVLNRGRLLPLPDGLAMMVPTNLHAMLSTQLISWPGKARLALDLILPARPVDGDESLGTFIGRRLGREAYENLIEPLVSGIYAGDGDRLSLASTFPYLRDMELKHGSLARGALASRPNNGNGRKPTSKGGRSAFLTPTTGLAEIVEALVEYLNARGVALHTNTPVSSIRQILSGYSVETEKLGSVEAAALILAAPAYASGSLLEALDSTLAEALESIPYASTATISLAYRQSDMPRPLDGYGYVIPRAEGREALACTWTSTKFPHRAPEGYALIRVFVGRAGQEVTRDEANLLRIAREEARLTLGITAEPLLSRIFIWDRAMPQYNLGHPEAMAAIKSRLEDHPGLALAGNAYDGIGIPDCIHSGELAVEHILAMETQMAHEQR
jgi:oxygen-dependent protoporphyrinogen oxidase